MLQHINNPSSHAAEFDRIQAEAGTG